MTWADYVAAVKATYWTSGTPSVNQQYRAIADFAHALFVRQIEGDLQVAKSYLDSYGAAKITLAGSRITASPSTVTAAVLALLPVDADTDNAGPMLNNAILQAIDDFNGTADNFDQMLLNAAMDLQRHVPYYQGRNETRYYGTSTGISNKGFVTKVTPPPDFRIQQVWCGRFFTHLIEGIPIATGDIIESNGRFYLVETGGILTEGQLGEGLQSQDRKVSEQLGSLTFNYHRDEKMVPVRKFPWADREALHGGRITSGPWYTVSPQFDSLWFYPPLIEDRQFFMLEWVGIKQSYQDDDQVTFDLVAQSAAAQYIRAMLSKDAAGDRLGSQSAMSVYQALLRKAVVDNQARELGPTNQVSELLYMNLGRSPWWWRFRCGTSPTPPPVPLTGCNSSETLENSGGDTEIVPTTSNQTVNVILDGSDGLRRFAVAAANSVLGDICNVLFVGPGDPAATPAQNIRVQITDDTVGGTVIFDYNFDGFTPSAIGQIQFDGAKWVPLRFNAPAF